MTTGSGTQGRLPARRAVLTGVVGLVGVAAGAGGEAWLGPSNSRGSDDVHAASAGEALMTEHGVLKRILLVYRAIIDRLRTGGTVSAGAVTGSAQIIADYIEGFHEGLEEAYVFPRLTTAQPELIRTLLVQHDRGRHITARVLATTSAALSNGTGRRALGDDLASFVRMYEPHEAWEDTVVFPELRRLTPQRELDLLAERFADLEAQRYGDRSLATMLDRVSQLERQLGIADLDDFTPAAT